MKEEQKYNGSKTRNYFTAYLLASIRGKRLRYLEKQQKILFAEENLEDKEYTDADISPEERLKDVKAGRTRSAYELINEL